MAAVQIRLMTNQDLAFADSLRALANWNQTLADWKRLLHHDSQGCFVAEWNGRPAGTVTTTTYSSRLAWIGMLLVHPEFRKRGIGRALLERSIAHLRSGGVRGIKLDATPQGLPLYEQLGFRSEWTLRRWQLSRVSLPKAPTSFRRATENDLDAIDNLDTESFGVSRRRLIESIVRDLPRLLVAYEGPKLIAYGIARDGARATYLGPISATSSEQGRNIAAALLADLDPAHPVFWDIPDPNIAPVSHAAELGFTVQRELTRMYLGENVSCRVEQLFGIAGPEVG